MPNNACEKTDREELIGYGNDGNSSGSGVLYFCCYLRSRDDGESEQVNHLTLLMANGGGANQKQQLALPRISHRRREKYFRTQKKTDPVD